MNIAWREGDAFWRERDREMNIGEREMTIWREGDDYLE